MKTYLLQIFTRVRENVDERRNMECLLLKYFAIVLKIDQLNSKLTKAMLNLS